MKKQTIVALGAGIAISLDSVTVASAVSVPFKADKMSSGYSVNKVNQKVDGQCGAGKCGANKAKKVGEAHCGGKKATDGKCGGKK